MGRGRNLKGYAYIVAHRGAVCDGALAPRASNATHKEVKYEREREYEKFVGT